jgi:prepilin-type processing-associated H-X9-DG protein/prepilin-type N-terminal cleavage/methylation domain-containing protein
MFWSARHQRPRSNGGAFTLIELMVVIGLISMLASLMLPVLGKMRAAAQSAVCTSNLRQMGQAWTMYTTESRGKLMPYLWQSLTTPDSAWNGYWPGVIENKGGVKGNALLCPSASQISTNAAANGYGTATTAWTGRFTAAGTAICFNATTYRNSSYGYNRYLTAAGGFGERGLATTINAVGDLCTIPMFFDCAFADAKPNNDDGGLPVAPPPDLQGRTLKRGQPEHWLFLLARHARGVNVCMADGHVRWVQLEDMYQMKWKTGWRKYRLRLPMR